MCYFSDFWVNLLIHAFLKFYLGKCHLDGNRHLFNIIYLVWELYLGHCIGSFSLLEKWVVATLFVERHFSSVLWPLVGDVRQITCSLIALTLNIHIFCLRAEAEGAILHATKKVWWMRSEFNISCGRGQDILVALPLQEVRITKCGRVWMGLIPETTYCLVA